MAHSYKDLTLDLDTAQVVVIPYPLGGRGLPKFTNT